MKTALLMLFPILACCQTRIAPMADPSSSNLPAQKIGANDLLSISVYDAPELTRTVRVDADGGIRLPMLKQRIRVEGLLPNQVEVALAEALQGEQLIVNPFVTVNVAEYHSRPISIMGAVRRPITFQAVGSTTLLEALSRAEGLSPEAGPEILVSRTQPGPGGTSTALVQRIPVKALIDAADPEMNLRLAGGEEIRVPEAGKIYVVGNVKKPGAFPIQDGGQSSVLRALALSEGLLPYAASQAFVYRREGASGGKNEIPIQLKEIIDRKAPDAPLLANDVLYIPDRAGRRASLAVLEKLLLFGGGAATALVYAGVR
jgi:polysaccharide export outer membrane protein